MPPEETTSPIESAPVDSTPVEEPSISTTPTSSSTPEEVIPAEPTPSPAEVTSVSPQPSQPIEPIPPSPRQTLLTTLISLREKAKNVIHARRNKKLEKIIAFALEQKGKNKEKGITNDQVEKLLHVSDVTATRYLESLVKEGRLTKSGVRGGVVYEIAG